MVEKVLIKEYSKHLIIADVCIDGILFNLVLACYYDGGAIFGRNWCLYSPNWNFCCKLSDDDAVYNLEQLPRRADGTTLTIRVRRFLANAITDILQKHSNDTNFSEQIEDIGHGTD